MLRRRSFRHWQGRSAHCPCCGTVTRILFLADIRSSLFAGAGPTPAPSTWQHQAATQAQLAAIVSLRRTSIHRRRAQTGVIRLESGPGTLFGCAKERFRRRWVGPGRIIKEDENRRRNCLPVKRLGGYSVPPPRHPVSAHRRRSSDQDSMVSASLSDHAQKRPPEARMPQAQYRRRTVDAERRRRTVS